MKGGDAHKLKTDLDYIDIVWMDYMISYCNTLGKGERNESNNENTCQNRTG